jgi:hypothetical protein
MTLCCIFKEEEYQNHPSAGNIMRPGFLDAEGCTVVDFLPRKEIIQCRSLHSDASDIVMRTL